MNPNNCTNKRNTHNLHTFLKVFHLHKTFINTKGMSMAYKHVATTE